jgi:putative transposase
MLKPLKKLNSYIDSVHSQVLQDTLKRLDKAFNNFFRRVKNGETPGYPRFKGKNQYDSFTYPQSGYKVINNYIKLSGIGNVKMKLHREIKGNIKTCAVVHKNKKYYVSLVTDYQTETLPESDKQVGIDMGIAHFCITSDGEFYTNPKIYKKALHKLKKTQRRLSRQRKSSNRRSKTKLMLSKQHEKVANQRKDIAHKVSKELITKYGLIAHEDLQIKNMVKNHNLAQSISDAGWGIFFTLLKYKAENAGRMVIAVNPHNTSQICSGCGCIVKKALSVRTHTCLECGLVLDRDINAAINILNKVS